MVYIKNHLLRSSIQDMILFEVFYYIKPSILHLQPFGRECFSHIAKEQCLSGSKLMPQAEEGIYLAYTDTSCIYKVHIPACNHTFIISTLDIKFKDTAAQSLSTTTFQPQIDVNLG